VDSHEYPRPAAEPAASGDSGTQEKSDAGKPTSLRERMEQHRANPIAQAVIGQWTPSVSHWKTSTP